MKTKSLFFSMILLAIISSCSDLNEEEVAPEIQLKAYQSGTHDGYFWSLWTDDRPGWVNYSNGSGGNYNVTWNYQGNFTCGKGWHNGTSNRRIGYNIGVHNHTGGGVIGYYGWTRNPLIEYYVNERWGSGRPTGSHQGSLDSDGGTYDIYTAMRYNAPSIDGTQTFKQVFSTRRSMAPTGQNRSITFVNHFNAWRNRGHGLGNDFNVPAIMVTEAYGGNSTGHVNLTIWNN